MLNIMVLAYQGVALEDLPKTEVVEERGKQLFDAYIERMFRRPTRGKLDRRYSEAQTKRWLAWLAQRMVQQSQTVFFIEGMQPRWLQTKSKIILCLLGIFLISWLISVPIGGLSFGLSFGLSVRLSDGLSDDLITGLFYGLIHGLSFGVISVSSAKGEMGEIKETLKWYWKEATNRLRRLIFCSIVSLLVLG